MGLRLKEQQSPAAFCAKTLRAAGLLPVAGVGSVVTARCGDAPTSPPCPPSQSLAAGPCAIFRRALRARLKIRRGPVFGERAAGRGATRENALHGSSTDGATKPGGAWRENPAGGGSFAGGRRWLGHYSRRDAPTSPPCPPPKSLAAGLRAIFRRALRRLQKPRVS